jgi:chromosome segregation ATPase
MELLAAMTKDTEARLEARLDQLALEQKESESRLESTMHRLADSMEKFTDLLGKLADAMALTAERQTRHESLLKEFAERLEASERSVAQLVNGLASAAGDR